MFIVAFADGGGGEAFTLHQIRELDGSHVGHVLAMALSNLKSTSHKT